VVVCVEAPSSETYPQAAGFSYIKINLFKTLLKGGMSHPNHQIELCKQPAKTMPKIIFIFSIVFS
tara:strand:- start:472 stop:666 length:195 start_codon:yes stop_codon:yes gene_type:complete